ncbi:MAG: class IV adenylate cyclase [Candidatus Kerfeldbacteria bacterium]
MKNVELKVKIDNHKDIVLQLKKIKAKKIAILNQVDTYFNCPSGRLKLREIINKKFELIYYRRPDSAKSKVSEYYILNLDKKQSAQTTKILSNAYGNKVVVKKRRELWMYRQTRVHLDTVSKLGIFLELETLTEKLNLSKAKIEHKEVINHLELNKFKKIQTSYSDLLLK